jgi:hypothetical protein
MKGPALVNEPTNAKLESPPVNGRPPVDRSLRGWQTPVKNGNPSNALTSELK